MKKIMRETTVWCQTIKLKEDLLIDKRMFDFTCLGNLYVTKVRNLIRSWLKRTPLSLSKLNSHINKSKDYIGTILRRNSSIPFPILLKIKKILKITLDNSQLLKILMKNKCRFFVFNKGGTPRPINLPVYPNQIIPIAKFLFPIGRASIYINRNTQPEILRKIERIFEVKVFKEGKYNLIIYSITLNRFLRTFYSYEKEFKIEFPLSDIVQELIGKVDLLKGVILPLIQSDGSVDKQKYGFYWCYYSKPKNKLLHNIFADAFYFTFRKYPSIYLESKQNGKLVKTAFILSKEESKKLIKMCGNTKKSPAKSNAQSSEDYLKETHPNIDYLKGANLETKIMAIRLWFCAEGSISVNRAKKNNLIRPRLHLACANPTLVIQLFQLCKDLGLDMNIEHTNKRKSWSGIIGLYSTSMKVIENFLKIGSFLPEIYISNVSKYYAGLEKQKLLLAILKYRQLEKEGNFSRSLHIIEVHKKIRKIIQGYKK